jgi:hypothetical protein
VYLRADDRVLLLAIPEAAALAAIGRILMQGVVVAAGPPDKVDSARQALADFDNIMLIDADPASPIPWRDAYFTKIVVAGALRNLAGAECRRLLAPGGEIVEETI